SETTRPAPWRFACRRTNQLPMPASGASRTRLEISMPPISKGSVSAGCSGVPLMDESQPLQGKHVVDLLDRLGEGDDDLRQPAGRQQAGVAELLLDPPHDAVDHAGEAEDEARLDRGAAGAADRRLRRIEVDPGDPRRAVDQRRQRDLQPRPDRAAEVLALGGDDIDVDAGAEVDDDAGLAEALVGGDRVDEAVGANLERVVDADRHPGLEPGADRQAPGVEVALAELLVLGAE